jgi:hypothetical protein
LSLTREQIHAGERGYLVYHGATLKTPLKEGQMTEVEIRLTNSGQTPAKEVFNTLDVGVFDACPPAPVVYQSIRGGYIGAGKEIVLDAYSLKGLQADEVSSITSEDVLLRGNILTLKAHPMLCFWGGVRYKDVFGGTGETNFCSVYNGHAKRFVACITGNELK